MQVGDIRIDAVLDGTAWFEPTLVFRGSTPEQWEAHRSLLNEDGKLGFSMGGFLVRGGGHTTLIDLGLGPKSFLGIEGGRFLTALAELGVGVEDVTDVVFTHLHFDHIGWAADEDGRPTFPNAAYRCDSADWEHFMVEHRGTEAEIIEPVAARFEMWSGSEQLLPGIDTLAAPGHTPGSSVIVVSSGQERAMMLGDVVHCAMELVDDEWDSLFDVDPDLALRTRVALNRELEGSGVPVAAAHFPGLQFGRLLFGEGRRSWIIS